jgi:hypothetical protein
MTILQRAGLAGLILFAGGIATVATVQACGYQGLIDVTWQQTVFLLVFLALFMLPPWKSQ